jgi:hypothetical protein
MEYYQFYHPIPIPDFFTIHVYCIFLSSRSIYFLDQLITLSRFIPRFYRHAVYEHVRTRPSFLKIRGVRTHLSLRTKIICCVRIISSSNDKKIWYWNSVIKLIIFHSFNELTCVVTVDLLLYKTMSYIPFGQDKAVIKTGNASIQVIHIVWDSISKLRSNRSTPRHEWDSISQLQR